MRNGRGKPVADRMTTGTDIPLWQQIRQKAQGSTDCAFWMAVADEVKRLTLSATASGEALREYGHHKNSCRFVSNVPNPGIRPGSCTCGLEAAMEKANGDPLKDSLERMYASALGQI